MLSSLRQSVSLRRCEVTFSDGDGKAIDPLVVSLELLEPDGTLLGFIFGRDREVVRTDVGAYRVELPVTQAGRHRVRWLGAGAGLGIKESAFHAPARAPVLE